MVASRHQSSYNLLQASHMFASIQTNAKSRLNQDIYQRIYDGFLPFFIQFYIECIYILSYKKKCGNTDCQFPPNDLFSKAILL